jgi:deoxyribonuclease-4
VRIGRHCSTAGSLERAAQTAVAAGANAVQIFSASPRMWRAKPPDPVQIKLLQAERDKHDIWPLVIHDSYLINLAAPHSIVRDKSIEAFRGEIERALLIGAEYLVTHPGNYKGLTAEQGILNVAEAMILAWRNVDPALTKKPKLAILLENTAGAGAQLGGKFEELATIRALVTPYLDIPVNFCLDTCHCYVQGFDLASEAGFQQLIVNAEESLGLKNVPVFHTNDAKAPLGSHLDRHANIGAGYIGLEGFRRLLNHPRVCENTPCEKAFICETPVDQPGDEKRDVTALKELVSPKKRSTSKQSSPNGTKNGYRTPRST